MAWLRRWVFCLTCGVAALLLLVLVQYSAGIDRALFALGLLIAAAFGGGAWVAEFCFGGFANNLRALRELGHLLTKFEAGQPFDYGGQIWARDVRAEALRRNEQLMAELRPADDPADRSLVRECFETARAACRAKGSESAPVSQDLDELAKERWVDLLQLPPGTVCEQLSDTELIRAGWRIRILGESDARGNPIIEYELPGLSQEQSSWLRTGVNRRQNVRVLGIGAALANPEDRDSSCGP